MQHNLDGIKFILVLTEGRCLLSLNLLWIDIRRKMFIAEDLVGNGAIDSRAMAPLRDIDT